MRPNRKTEPYNEVTSRFAVSCLAVLRDAAGFIKHCAPIGYECIKLHVPCQRAERSQDGFAKRCPFWLWKAYCWEKNKHGSWMRDTCSHTVAASYRALSYGRALRPRHLANKTAVRDDNSQARKPATGSKEASFWSHQGASLILYMALQCHRELRERGTGLGSRVFLYLLFNFKMGTETF